ncbi:Retrotransposon protein, Ty3-gypsy subclass [Gossypium australe]|uniref:Retrotransposon protein, Ty3-gypsy subclass n=1 Tax=Gossypium australe TaxID=47621 RepID=A0A5B6WI13_9ROSI|nr:Retrotransposon protein, Ty3-gypsy subclass [Gossypium australe]
MNDSDSQRYALLLVLEFEGSWEKYLPLVKFAYNNSFQSSIKMAPYAVLYGRKCRTPLYWTELSKRQIHGIDLVREIEEKVKKVASDRQKSYANLKRKEIKFQVSDKVFLKVSPWKKILRFGRKGKLSLHFIGSYKNRTGGISISFTNRVRKDPQCVLCVDVAPLLIRPSYIISPTEVEIRPDMTYGEEPIKILAQEVRQLRNKSIGLVKVLWQRNGVEEATWEPEEAMKNNTQTSFLVRFSRTKISKGGEL